MHIRVKRAEHVHTMRLMSLFMSLDFIVTGYSAAALMAIIVAIPFTVRILVHHEIGEWTNFYQAFFHTYLELYLGNSCLGKSFHSIRTSYTSLPTTHINPSCAS